MARPTMHDVARVAGVSVTTVSRCINNDRYVRDTTRQRVEAAIAELGFLRNDIARTLRPGQATTTIALVIEDVANPFYSGIARGVDEVAQQNGHLLVVGNTELSFERERELLGELVRRRVDGLLVVPTAHDHSQLHNTLAQWAPIVYIDRAPTGVSADSVLLDNRGGVRQAVEHLIANKHRRIAYVGGEPTVYTGAQRLAGYRHSLRKAGLPYNPDLVSLGHHTVEAARDAVTELLSRRSRPTAIFADNNRMTTGVLQAVAAADRHVAVAGFDDLELADLLTMQVALVSYRPDDLGRTAATLLFDRIRGQEHPPRKIVIKTELKLRGRDT
jgi:LacI family transcriptional regulator